jgi:hypothetical protein
MSCTCDDDRRHPTKDKLMTFITWLVHQCARQDAVGTLARVVKRDPIKHLLDDKLRHILVRYEHLPQLRYNIKKAHREWRRLNSRERAA